MILPVEQVNGRDIGLQGVGWAEGYYKLIFGQVEFETSVGTCRRCVDMELVKEIGKFIYIGIAEGR